MSAQLIGRLKDLLRDANSTRGNKYEVGTALEFARRLAAIIEQEEAALPYEANYDSRHTYVPHPKHPWFCKHCGYAPHETLKHYPED